jgi:hypothetical protein
VWRRGESKQTRLGRKGMLCYGRRPFGLDLGTWLRSEVFGAGLYRRGKVKVGEQTATLFPRGRTVPRMGLE